MKKKPMIRISSLVAFIVFLTLVSNRLQADTGICGGATVTLPFTDVMGNVFYCQIAEAYFSGLTNGTSPTTYGPSQTVTREQMAAFLTRTLDQSVKRSSRRAALNQYWTTQATENLGLTDLGALTTPEAVQSDGRDVWVAGSDSVWRVRASDGKLLDTWTGATGAKGVLCAMGKVFVIGETMPGKLFQIDPTQPAGPVTTLTSNLGSFPRGIAYDGQRIWTANNGGSVSIVTLNPLTVTTVRPGLNQLYGIAYDGANMWVTDDTAGSVDKLRKLDSNGAVLLSVDVGDVPVGPVFDGTNIWVPCATGSLTVVRAIGGLAGTVLATLTGNGLNNPYQAAFDGERIIVTSELSGTLSLFRASDLTPLGTVPTGPGSHPLGVCSDGVDFWIALSLDGKVARF